MKLKSIGIPNFKAIGPVAPSVPLKPPTLIPLPISPCLWAFLRSAG
jgi:hypothetical protein